jgi:hypothetical protein
MQADGWRKLGYEPWKQGGICWGKTLSNGTMVRVTAPEEGLPHDDGPWKISVIDSDSLYPLLNVLVENADLANASACTVSREVLAATLREIEQARYELE